MFDVILVGLGTSVAKVAMSMWLQEPDLKVDAISGVVESLANLSGNLLAARSGNRQFEKIGEHAAHRIMYMYEIEFKQWSDEEFTAVINAASDTVRNANITPRILAHYNLDEKLLTSHLKRTSNKYRTGLNINEVSVLERLLVFSSELILEFAAQLPHFTTQVLGEILSREELIINEINDIAKRFSQFQEQSYNRSVGGVDTRKYRSDYLRILSRKLGYMELYGSDLSGASRRHSLNIAYINLSLRRINQENELVLKANEAISHSRKLFIRGTAGSGKSTLLKWIAVNIANKELKGHLEPWNELVPFLIRLRQCVDRDALPTPSEFPSMIAPHLIENNASDWVDTILTSGQAIIMIDGVDEISKRGKVKEWVDDLVFAFPKCRFIITSRPLVSSDIWQNPEGFDEAELLPMRSSDISLFIEYWHKAVEIEVFDRGEKNQMNSLGHALIRILQSNSAIRNLCSSPLLCAMVCALHKDKHRNLPSNRLEIYEACTKMLLEEREKGRGIRVDKYPEFTYSQLTGVLSELAYNLMLNGWSEITRKRATKHVANTLNSYRRKDNQSSEKILDYFIERTGMIFEPTSTTIGFIHRTFQEYLAAKAAVYHDATGLLKRNALDPLWREVIILATGLANQNQKNDILEDLLSTNEYTGEDRKSIDLIAAACMETVTALRPDIRNMLESRLSGLLPPKNLVEAKSVALIGDIAVPHLTPDKCANHSVCVNTLEMIGTKSAVNILLQYLELDKSEVIEEVAIAFESISADINNKKHLEEVHLSTLICDSKEKYEVLKYVYNIDHLILRNYNGQDLEIINHIKNLRKLTIDNCSRLIKLPRWSPIYDKNSRLIKVALVDQISTITDLTIIGCSSLKNGNDIGKLHNLKHLELIDNSIQSFDFITNLTSLRKLTLKELPHLKKLPKFEKFNNFKRDYDYFEKLHEIQLINCDHLENINSLQNNNALLGKSKRSNSAHGAKNLSTLIIGGCPLIKDLSVLESKPILKQIVILQDDIGYEIPSSIQSKVVFRDNQ